MTLAELTKRVEELEKQLAAMQQKVEKATESKPWWITGAGRFANDPVFDEIVRLGREYRESLRPGGKKKSKKR
jgi:hypothetical protein